MEFAGSPPCGASRTLCREQAGRKVRWPERVRRTKGQSLEVNAKTKFGSIVGKPKPQRARR